jgi:hypothetical protein
MRQRLASDGKAEADQGCRGPAASRLVAADAKPTCTQLGLTPL